ncbi:hypothetical protein CEXT_127091 [Caerostris extrusa]|uniref:Ribosomal protein S7 n=1 Tax=Caerostris extrusa TaxID=172846 RepID=A0AAV4Y3V2_CAEEX|nr:hypothetical protein CEXT_127091 [Caerostris extrusa]
MKEQGVLMFYLEPSSQEMPPGIKASRRLLKNNAKSIAAVASIGKKLLLRIRVSNERYLEEKKGGQYSSDFANRGRTSAAAHYLWF